MLPARRFLLAAAAALLGGACGPPPRTATGATDLEGADFGRDFELADTGGRTRRLADFRGRVVVLFFGYTQCPDACPTTLADLRAALALLGPAAGKVQVLFVTVDPERDTAEVLAAYTQAFDRGFIALRGSPEQTAATAREFKALIAKVPTQDGRYVLDHTVGSYVIDAGGRLRMHLPLGHPPAAIAAELRRVLG